MFDATAVNISFNIWWILVGIFLFGMVLPLLMSHAIAKIWQSLKISNKKYKYRSLNVIQSLVLGWVTLIPVYFFSYAYVAMLT